MKRAQLIFLCASSVILFATCSATTETMDEEEMVEVNPEMQMRANEYASFKLTADLSLLSENERSMIPILIEAAELMDQVFWKQAYGDKASIMEYAKDPATRAFVQINYGPWARLDEDEPFIDGIGPKAPGAQFYPQDMSKEEFESWDNPDKTSLYTLVRRDEAGTLEAIPYHEAYAQEHRRAAELLQKAALLAEDAGLQTYLNMRAEALLTDDYQPSDIAWMDMADNTIDIVIGPIENYEDQLFNYKAAHEAYVLIKDKAWSARLAKYAEFLPQLQEGLPVPSEYKSEKPGTNSQLNAYDAVYYAGDGNAGSKTIAINLPNDEEVQLAKGSRRLQLKNTMRAKFDKIMVPISGVLIDESQRGHVTFHAFFSNTMFHEIAHGLGIKNTINDKGTVRHALLEKGSALEEGKADVLGLYMITKLHEIGEIEGDLMDYYVTFLAGIFRSVRFGATSSHGQANMIRFNYFQEMDAFSFNEETGMYTLNFDKFQIAMEALSADILILQGDGDYEGVTALFEAKGNVGTELQAALDRLAEEGIPRDIVFEQGIEILGLE